VGSAGRAPSGVQGAEPLVRELGAKQTFIYEP